MHIYIIYMPCICNNYVYYVQTACYMHLYASDIQKYACHMHLYAKYVHQYAGRNAHAVCRKMQMCILYADIMRRMHEDYMQIYANIRHVYANICYTCHDLHQYTIY